ncbi:iron-containing alcohol dehydrogenase [Oceanobacillus profundus]|uniref:iron-containing alcohol dehydrogenase n=1 Tax=Oceanobacillus profundus TaxID=372463 RepID=UPI0026E3700B|nr:iron-containing alcohol dehydrogenase [Oceanobacillus profundus]MDO6448660.1 iron-containing alcohol dehydrogenase [Oceanobacillus profundus]
MASTYLPRQIELGSNSLEHLGKIAVENGATKLFIVMDAFLASEGLNYDVKIKSIVQKQNLAVTIFSDYRGEPTTDHLLAALDSLLKSNADCVVAIGGGSAIDIAKAASVFAVNPTLAWEDIAAQNRLKRLPLLAVPTTAGTGSEATKVMVVKNMKTEIKMNPGHKDLVPDVAILDPLLTKSLPSQFTAYTGLDALAHAMEAYVSTLASATTDNYALNAIRMIGRSLPKVYENGANVEAREEMLLASCYAGIAFSNASTNLAHAAGRPLGARFNIPHGLSVALLLPFVVEFGLEASAEKYAAIAVNLGEEDTGERDQLAKQAHKLIKSYNDKFAIWEDALRYIDLEEFKDSIPLLVEDSFSGNGIVTNPKVPEACDVERIFHSLLKKLTQIAQIQTA